MDLIATVTGIILLEYFVFVMMAGMIRGKSGIQAPATTGDPGLERILRIQQNTLEQLVIVLPSLWIFGHYISEPVGAGAGLVFIFGRALYCRGYLADPAKRGIGFLIGLIATAVLLFGGLYGAIMAAL